MPSKDICSDCGGEADLVLTEGKTIRAGTASGHCVDADVEVDVDLCAACYVDRTEHAEGCRCPECDPGFNFTTPTYVEDVI